MKECTMTDEELKAEYQKWLHGDNTYTLEFFQKEYKKRGLNKK